MKQEIRFYKKLVDQILDGNAVGVYCEPKTYHKRLVSINEEYSANVEWYEKYPKIVICGGGHISLALSKILPMLDFEVIIIDDRKEFANEERFPEVCEVIYNDFAETLKNNEFGRNTYYIIVTRGHEHDYTCLMSIINKSCKYIGMIGSRSKVKLTMDKLRKQGIDERIIADVYSPIGLKIGAKTPQEVAICIAAEIISVNRADKHNISFLESEIMFVLERELEGVLVSLVEEHGSSPGKKGSHMFIDGNGNIYGTIGGGNLEYTAIDDGKNYYSQKARGIKSYNLSNTEAGKLGMACGGEVTLLFEYLEGK